MKYQDFQPISKQDIEKAFASSDVKRICKALLSVALNDPDWKWAQNQCLDFLGNESSDVRGLAATCLGHIARIHGQLDKDKVIIALREHLDDNIISGKIEDALDDIDIFLQ